MGRIECCRVDQEIGYKVGPLPSSYLSMPSGALFKPVLVWYSTVEERLCKILTLLKR